MCGISCICNLVDVAANPHYLHQKTQGCYQDNVLIRRRGPDAESSIFRTLWSNVAAVFTGCILHMHGHMTVQPLKNDFGDLLLFNGEIFGGIPVGGCTDDASALFSRLCQCDNAEDVLSCLSSIYGPWSFIFWQASLQCLWYGRDLFGRRSLLWSLPKPEDPTFTLSSVPVNSLECHEVPSVGIFCLHASVCSVGPPLLMELFPWKDAIWPGTEVRLLSQSVCNVAKMLCLTKNMYISFNVCCKMNLHSHLPELNSLLPQDDLLPFDSNCEASNALSQLESVLHDPVMESVVAELMCLLKDAVEVHVANLPDNVYDVSPDHLEGASSHHEAPCCDCCGQLVSHCSLDTKSCGSSDDVEEGMRCPCMIRYCRLSSFARNSQAGMISGLLGCSARNCGDASNRPCLSTPHGHLHSVCDYHCNDSRNGSHNWKSVSDICPNQSTVCFSQSSLCDGPNPLVTSCENISTPPRTAFDHYSVHRQPSSGAVAVSPPPSLDVSRVEDTRSHPVKVAILFSGGVDSTVLAAMMNRCLPPDQPVDLINVAFEQKATGCKVEMTGTQHTDVAGFEPLIAVSRNRCLDHMINMLQLRVGGKWTVGNGDGLSCVSSQPGIISIPGCGSMFNVPDRLSGHSALSELNQSRPWNFVEVNVTLEELKEARSRHIRRLVYPLSSVLDDSIGCALWFAARGEGILGNTPLKGKAYTSTAKASASCSSEEKGICVSQDGNVPLSLTRVFIFAESEQKCSILLHESLDVSVLLLGTGADELLAGYSRHRTRFQVISDHGKTSRLPFLDEKVVAFLAGLPVHHKADLRRPRGVGEKLLLRLVAYKLGLRASAVRAKRAIQFGSRIARLEECKEKGNRPCSRLFPGSGE